MITPPPSSLRILGKLSFRNIQGISLTPKSKFAGPFCRYPNDAKARRFFSRQAHNIDTGSPRNLSTPFKLALSVSGVIFVCGLDFVAPSWGTDPPDKTYWNDTSVVSKDATAKNPKDRSALVRVENQSSSAPYYQLVVVGGGMAGLHTALAFAERRKQLSKNENTATGGGGILILDAKTIGQAASGKAKGLVVPGIQVPEDELAGICGSKSIAKQVYELTYQAAKRLKTDIVQRYKIDCGWVDSGVVEATVFEEAEEENHNETDNKGEEDDGSRALTASEVRQVLGQPESSTLYKGGEFNATCCGVDPFALTTGLANVLEDRFGARICEQTKVTKIDTIAIPTTDNSGANGASSTHAKYIVTTESGAQVECQHVVLCTGSELVSRELSKMLANAVIPIYTWMVSTAPLGDQCPLKSGAIENLHPSDANKQNNQQSTSKPAPMGGDDFVCLNYWRATDDGRILFGSLADAYPVPQWLAEWRLRRALRQVYPHLGDVPFDHVWGGCLAYPRDAVPLIGRDEGYDQNVPNTKPSDGGVWYATGFGGHGIVPTVMAGSVLADAMLGIDDETWRLFQREFPPKYSFWPVSRIGAQAILTTYNVFDWLHVKGVPVPRLPKPW